MISWEEVKDAFEKYSEIKAAIPALQSLFDSLTASVAKIQALYAKEEAALQDLLKQKASALSSLLAEKDSLLKDLQAARDEAKNIKDEALKILELAKLKHVEAAQTLQDANTLKADLNVQAGHIEAKKSLLKTILEKLG